MIGAINSSNINVLVAFGGGIISILSPCVLPMVPGYLSLVTGLTVTELEGGEHQHLVRIAMMTGLFALGLWRGVHHPRPRLDVDWSDGVPQSGDAHAGLRAGRVRDGALPRGLAVPPRSAAVSGEAVPGQRPLRHVHRACRRCRVRVRLVAVPRPRHGCVDRRRLERRPAFAPSRCSSPTQPAWAWRSCSSVLRSVAGRRRSTSSSAT